MDAVTLLPFQEQAVEIALERNLLLSDDCGLGKTLVAAEVIKRTEGRRFLVICPRTTKPWWAEVLESQRVGHVRMTEAAGRLTPYTGPIPGKHIILAHPAGVRLAGEALSAYEWDLVVVDEAHNFKNRKAAQTKALWKLSARKKLALTATPYGRDPSDLWALLHWLYPQGPPWLKRHQRRLFTSFWRFFSRFVDAYRPVGERYSIVRGPQNLDELADLMRGFFLRRTKDEVMPELPPITYTDVPVELSPKQDALYTELLRDEYAEVEGAGEIVLENALVVFVRLHQIALDPGLIFGKPFPLGEIPAKVDWLREWLEDHPDEKVVIVSRYRRFVEAWLADLFPGAVIVGGMTSRETESALRTFEQGRGLVGTLDCVCEGLNLQAASTIIVTDGTWSPAKAYQLTQRIHRIGQTRPCQVIHLVGQRRCRRWTVDYRVRRAQVRRTTEAEMLREFILEGRDL